MSHTSCIGSQLFRGLLHWSTFNSLPLDVKIHAIHLIYIDYCLIYFVVSFLICLARSCLCGILLWGLWHIILKNPLGLVIRNSIPPFTLYLQVLNISSINCQPLPAQFTSGWLMSGWHWDHTFSYANPTNSLYQHAVYPSGCLEIGQSHLQPQFHLHTENDAFSLLKK